METIEALRIIEALRSGVPSRKVSAVLSRSREEVVRAIENELDRIHVARRAKGAVIRADYGEGKTHLLHQIFNIAHKKGFVVSMVPLSKETPFDKLHKVFPKVASCTYLPDSTLPGFEFSLRKIREGSEQYYDLLEFSEKRLHPKIHNVLRNYYRSDISQAYSLLDDLSGHLIKIPTLKAIHRLNFGEALRIPSFKLKEHMWDYFRLLDHLFFSSGYSGWVLLFDEAELIGKLSIIGRAMTYNNMWRFLFDREQGLSRTFTVFSVSNSFFTDEIPDRDLERVTLKLRERGLERESQRAEAALKYLMEESIDLPPLNEDDLRGLLNSLNRIYNTAYASDLSLPADTIVSRLSHDARLRSIIRYSIEYMDLEYLYGKGFSIGVGGLNEGVLKEDAGYFDSDGEGESPG